MHCLHWYRNFSGKTQKVHFIFHETFRNFNNNEIFVCKGILLQKIVQFYTLITSLKKFVFQDKFSNIIN